MNCAREVALRIVEVMPEFGLAGAERMAENLILALKENGHDVLVVSLFDFESSITQHLESKGVEVRYLGKKPGLDLSVIKKLRQLIRAYSADIVHTHRYVLQYVYPACIGLRNVSIVHTVHNVANREIPKKQQGLQGLFFRSSRVTPVAISPLVKESIAAQYNIDVNEIPEIYNGVDLALKNECLADNNRSERFELLHIGRYSFQKNHRLLIDSFARVARKNADVCLTLLGDGELFGEISDLIDTYGIRSQVNQVGKVDDVVPYLLKADAFVLSSRYEGFPISLIEAFLAGLPCISTNVGGVPDIIKHGVNGLLVEENEESLSNAIMILAEESEYRLALGVQAKTDSSRYTRDAMTSGYESLFSSLIGDR